MNKQEVKNILSPFSKVIIWGLKSNSDGTHRHIHRHLYDILKKIGINVEWCNDDISNTSVLIPDCLVISYDRAINNLLFKKDVYYALLNTVKTFIPGENCKNYIHWRVFGEVPVESGSNIWGDSVAFNKKSHMLYQSWATNLLPEEFLPPVFNNNAVFNWVGSIWNDRNNHGNIENIQILKTSLEKHNIKFVHYQNVSDEDNILYIRESRIAPAIGGASQVLRKMLPCRLWKNISYGQLGVTNLIKSLDVFKDSIICDTNILNLVDKSLSIKEKEYKNMTEAQQKVVAENYTYLNWFYNLGRAFEEVK